MLVLLPVPGQDGVLHEDEAPPNPWKVLGYVLHIRLGSLRINDRSGNGNGNETDDRILNGILNGMRIKLVLALRMQLSVEFGMGRMMI